MVDLASFFTPNNSSSIQSTGTLGSSTAAKSDKGFGIFDLLLAQIEKQIANGEQPITEAQKAVKNSEGTSALVKILANNEDIADDVNALDKMIGMDILSEIQNTLALNQQAFDNTLQASQSEQTALDQNSLQADKNIETLTIADITKALHLEKGNNNVSLSNKISSIVNKIRAISKDENPTILSALNVTPEQITEIQTIQDGVVPSEEQLEAIEDLIIGLVSLIPPSVKQDIIIPTQIVRSSGKPASLDLSNQSSTKAANDSSLSSSSSSADTNSTDASLADSDFEAALKVALDKGYKSNASLQAHNQNNLATTPNAAALATANATPTTNSLQGWPFSLDGSIFANARLDDQVAEQMGLTINGSQNIGQGSLTALVTQAHASTQAHPATQLVAASIQKAAQNGQDTNISLRLDPPDLGRVDVHLTFGKDKTIKTVVTAEKPETYMMLQRDAHVLERALQDAGLDADGGLSFELAQDGQFFDDNNQRGGGHNRGGTGAHNGTDLGDGDLIESTMTWHVNPENGHTHYNILA